MEIAVFAAVVVVVLVYMLWRTRRGGIADYVPGGEIHDPKMLADEASLRAGDFPGPGGPMDGAGGGNVVGGG